MQDSQLAVPRSPRSSQRSASEPPAALLTRLTRMILAHKRIVVVFWVVLTLIGGASAGSATKALKQKFSVPGKEGWVTNQQIAARLPRHRRQRRSAAGGRDAAGRHVGELAGRQRELRGGRSAPASSTLPGTRTGRLREHRQPRVRLGATAARRSSSPTRRRTRSRRSTTTPNAAKNATRGARRRDASRARRCT